MPEIVNTSVLSVDAETDSIEDNRPTMIKVDHVSMVFNKASEQLNSLKEYAIKLAKRQLFFEGFKALDDVSFEVKKGDVFGIMGTNGSGKSTMLKIIAGVLEPTSGTCEINGKIAPLIELGAGFDMDLTARENVYLNGALLGYSKDFIDEHFDEIVDFAEIESFLDMPLKNYSSGMVARIAFAIATVIVPEILVVDEVLSVGDFMFQKKCEDRINELIEQHGVTVLIVSHSNDQIARLCNKAIWIEKGHTRLMGDAAMVTRVYGGLGGRTGSPEAEARVFEALVRLNEEDSLKRGVRIAGEDSVATNVRAVLSEKEKWNPSAIALASDGTHANAILANSFASEFSIPVLSTKPDYLSDSVQRILFDERPETLFLFDYGAYASIAATELSSLPWNPEVVHFSNTNSSFLDLSLRIIQEGIDRGLWKNAKSIVVLGFDDNVEAFAISPVVYQEKCPVLIFDARNASEAVSQIVGVSDACGIKDVLLVGNQAASIASDLVSQGVRVETIAGHSSWENCIKAAEIGFDSCASLRGSDSERDLYLSSTSLSQWPDLISSGSCAGVSQTSLLLVDEADLDSISSALDFIKQRKGAIRGIKLIGGSGEQASLLLALLCNELDISHL